MKTTFSQNISINKTMTEKVEIPAIHEREFMDMLGKLGLLNQISEGKAICFNCHENLSLDSIAGIKIIDNQPKLICNNPECLSNE